MSSTPEKTGNLPTNFDLLLGRLADDQGSLAYALVRAYTAKIGSDDLEEGLQSCLTDRLDTLRSELSAEELEEGDSAD